MGIKFQWSRKMPTYVYCEILDDGTEGEMFEIEQHMNEPTLEVHPQTGRKVRKVFMPPNLASKYTPGATASRLDTQNVEKHGFTKYERDKLTGKYHKTAGKDQNLPNTLNANKLRQMGY